MRARGRPRHPGTLTARQFEVWQLLREGLTYDEIAARLHLSHDGVKFHVADILRRLGVTNRYDAAAWEPESSEGPHRTRGLLPAPFAKPTLTTFAYVAGAAVIAVSLAFVALLSWGVVSDAISDDKPAASLRSPSLPEERTDLGELAFTLYGDLLTVNVDGSNLARLAIPGVDHSVSLTSPSFSPDGSRLALIGDRRDVIVTDSDGAASRTIDLFVDRTVAGAASDTSIGPVAVHWSPNGEWLLVTRQRIGGSGFTDVVVVRPDGSDLRTVIDEAEVPSFFIEATWSKSRAPGSGDASIVIIGGADGLTGIAYDLEGNLLGPAYAPATSLGAAVYQSPTDESVLVAGAKGNPEFTNATAQPIILGDITGTGREVAEGCGIAWSPDGLSFAFFGALSDGSASPSIGLNLMPVDVSAANGSEVVGLSQLLGDPMSGVSSSIEFCDGFGVDWRS